MKKINFLLILAYIVLIVIPASVLGSDVAAIAVSAAPGAAGKWTPSIDLYARYSNVHGKSSQTVDVYCLIVGSSFVGTATLQISFDGGTTFYDMQTFTGDGPHIYTIRIPPYPGIYHRIGVDNGDFTSGSVAAKLIWGTE